MPEQSGIPFWKMSGSGNDFVVIDNRAGHIAQRDASAFTKAVCRHRVSVGADGVVLIDATDEPEVDFQWRYINADGSDGEMCGNGAMCGARFAVLNGIAGQECVFRTESGLVQAWVDADPASPRVSIAVQDPGAIRADVSIEAAGVELAVHSLLVGVPHVVAIVDDADEFAATHDLIGIGRAVRHHPEFAPAGTNVNFISIRDRSTIRMRTYERGVEDETLACGTGSIASAIVATSLGLTESPVDVITSSGRILAVSFEHGAHGATSVRLGGEARIVMRGEIDPEALT